MRSWSLRPSFRLFSTVCWRIFPAPHTWFTSSFFWPETWEKVWNLSHPYTFLFNSAKSCARSKAGFWERDPGGIKEELRASLQDTDRPPSHGASRRRRRLSHVPSRQRSFRFWRAHQISPASQWTCQYLSCTCSRDAVMWRTGLKSETVWTLEFPSTALKLFQLLSNVQTLDGFAELILKTTTIELKQLAACFR